MRTPPRSRLHQRTAIDCSQWPGAVPTSPIDPADHETKYHEWLERIERSHGGSHHGVSEQPDFSRLETSPAEATVVMVSTAGVPLAGQELFDTATVVGDAGHRLIPHDVDRSRLRFSHTHYDTGAAQENSDVVLPIGALDAAVAGGRVGAAAPHHARMMGFNPDRRRIAEEAGPAVAEQFRDAGADVVLLVPG